MPLNRGILFALVRMGSSVMNNHKEVEIMEMKRSQKDRRSGADRRGFSKFWDLLKVKDDKRSGEERRSKIERRVGWIRVTKWCSALLENLTLAKYLK